MKKGRRVAHSSAVGELVGAIKHFGQEAYAP
jgi:hypothetical protein